MWTPGGSEPFCALHEELLTEFASADAALSGSSLQCGIGADAEFTQALLGGIAAGNPPDFSMVWESPVPLGMQGAFLPLDDYMKTSKNLGIENWPEGMLKTCRFKGATYGVPITAGIYGIWYNEEMLEAKGLKSDRVSFPKTWDEMRKLSKEFTKWDGDRLEIAGFMPPREAETIPIWSALNGGRIFDADNLKYQIDSEANIQMFEYFVAWLDEEYKGDINAVDRSGAWRNIYASDDGLPPSFQLGRLAGVEAGSWGQGDIYSTTPPTFTRWNVAPHPVGPGGSGSVSGTWPNWFVVPKGAHSPEKAIAYLDYLAVDGVQRWYKRITDMPMNLKVPEVLADVVVEKRGEEFAREIAAFFRKQAQVVTPMWDSPVQSFGHDQIKLAAEKIYTKAESVKAALSTAQAAAQGELDKVMRG